MAADIRILGGLLDDDADVLVNTVNVRGPRGPTMGRGLARAFADRWPAILPIYREECRNGNLYAGACRLYPLPAPGPGHTRPEAGDRNRAWAAFCTKDNWQDSSRYEWVLSGLNELLAAMRFYGYASVAVPALGCSNGKLDWERVEPMIRETFQGSGLDLRLYDTAGHLMKPCRTNQTWINC